MLAYPLKAEQGSKPKPLTQVPDLLHPTLEQLRLSSGDLQLSSLQDPRKA